MYQVIFVIINFVKIQVILQVFEEIFGEGLCYIMFVVVESGVLEQFFGSEEMCVGV